MELTQRQRVGVRTEMMRINAAVHHLEHQRADVDDKLTEWAGRAVPEWWTETATRQRDELTSRIEQLRASHAQLASVLA